MTALDAVKRYGFGMAEFSEMSGISQHTLRNWYRDRPDAFRLMLKGCAAERAGIDLEVFEGQAGQ